MNNTNNVTINLSSSEKVSVTNRKLTDLVQASIVYPKFKSVKDKEVKEAFINYDYHCSTTECFFSPVEEQITKCTLAESKGVREISAAIVKELRNIPTASTSAGFIIQSGGGASIMYIKNKDITPKEGDLVGFIDVTEVRRRLIYEHLVQQENRHHLETALIGGTIGAIGGVTLMGIALKLLKKI